VGRQTAFEQIIDGMIEQGVSFTRYGLQADAENTLN